MPHWQHYAPSSFCQIECYVASEWYLTQIHIQITCQLWWDNLWYKLRWRHLAYQYKDRWEMHMAVLQNPNLQLIKLASSNPRHQKSASRRWRLYTSLAGSLQMLISRQTGEINLVTILIRMLVKKPLSLSCLTEGPSIWFACLVAFYREEWEPAAKKDIWQTLHFKDV